MDTISRENNSMLPVGGIIVGVIALLLGGYSAITLSKVNRQLSEAQPKIDKIDTLESQVATAAQAAQTADKAGKDVQALQRSMQSAFDQVGNELMRISGTVTKLEEAAKKPAAAPAGGKKGEAPVAGPNEYIVKPGDGGAKIARANGVSLSDLQAVNPGVNWNKLSIGQKIKLPAKK
jgi:LysM repeat protein